MTRQGPWKDYLLGSLPRSKILPLPRATKCMTRNAVKAFFYVLRKHFVSGTRESRPAC
jgi:hypothetical protein